MRAEAVAEKQDGEEKQLADNMAKQSNTSLDFTSGWFDPNVINMLKLLRFAKKTILRYPVIKVTQSFPESRESVDFSSGVWLKILL